MPRVPLWFRRRDPDLELREEIETHLSLEVQRQMSAGLSRTDAEAAAARKFGSVLRCREESRNLRRGVAIERLWVDLRDALRALRHRPFASTAAIVALAVAMAVPAALLLTLANLSTAVFPLVREPASLALIVETPPNRPGQREPASDATWRVWRDHASNVAAISTVQTPLPLTLSWAGLPEQVTVQPMATGLLPLLGVSPAIGRGFVESDGAEGGPLVALISYAFWRARFGGAPDVIGSSLTVDGRPRTVVGVMPQGFWITRRNVDMWVPLPAEQGSPGRSFVIARLHAGDSRENLAKRLAALSAHVAAANPERAAGWGVRVVGLGVDSILFNVLEQPGAVVLLVAIALVLIVACANVAMLMLARGAARQKESAVRSALGASRTRLIRQFLAESTCVSVAGAALALLLAHAAMQLIMANVTSDLPMPIQPRMDLRVAAAVTLLAAIVGVLAGLAPALGDSRLNLVAALKETGFFTTAPGKQRFRKALIAGEVGLTVMLLAVVSLLVRGAADLEQTPPGFDPDRLFIVRLDGTLHLAGQPAPHPPAAPTLGRIRQVPGVESAAAVLAAPPGTGSLRVITTAATSPTDQATSTPELVNAVSGEYFRTLGLTVLSGRTFAENEGATHTVAVVSLAFARKHWRGDVIGQTLTIAGEPAARQVIGVVSDQLLHEGRRAAAPVVFVPFTGAWQEDWRPNSVLLLIRTAAGSRDVVRGIRQTVAEGDPLQTVRISAVRDIMSVGAQEVRAGAIMTGPLMLLALLLTVSGLYGLMAQNVAQRTHELAIRVTLGAGRRALLRLVAQDGLTLSAGGAVAGIAGALVIDRFLTVFLFGIPGEEPIALAGAALVMVLVTTVAVLVPYRRALRIDPGRTLRYE
jgi:putative ABC transport system permease protein